MDYEKDYTFRRGDICWYEDHTPIDLNSNILQGNHPVVVVSANRLNEVSSLVTVVPMPDQMRTDPGGEQDRPAASTRQSEQGCDGRSGGCADGCPWHRDRRLRDRTAGSRCGMR